VYNKNLYQNSNRKNTLLQTTCLKISDNQIGMCLLLMDTGNMLSQVGMIAC